MKKNKNVSKSIKNGTVIYTRDEYFEDHNNYQKPKYKNSNKLYRDAIVIETNRNGELALIKIQSGGKKVAVNKSGQIEKYNPYVKTKDDKGKPIRINRKFRQGSSKYGVTPSVANNMKKLAVTHPNSSVKRENKNQLRSLKGRKKKNS